MTVLLCSVFFGCASNSGSTSTKDELKAIAEGKADGTVSWIHEESLKKAKNFRDGYFVLHQAANGWSIFINNPLNPPKGQYPDVISASGNHGFESYYHKEDLPIDNLNKGDLFTFYGKGVAPLENYICLVTKKSVYPKGITMTNNGGFSMSGSIPINTERYQGWTISVGGETVNTGTKAGVICSSVNYTNNNNATVILYPWVKPQDGLMSFMLIDTGTETVSEYEFQIVAIVQ